MLRVTILCVGKLKEAYWREACAEYEKRLRPFAKFSVQELPEERLPDMPGGAQTAAALRVEGERILQAAGGAAVVPLCIEGRELSSPQLADWIGKEALGGTSEIAFVIGSSFGLSEEVKAAGKLRLSMSPMTFPHQLARVMLCEQVYRAFQILNHGKYHK